MSRTILYYPSIVIRNPRWIRQMILYWDAIGAIVPQDLWAAVYASADLKKLRKAGMFRTYRPDDLVSGADALTIEFQKIHVNAGLPKADLDVLDRKDSFSIFARKMPEELARYVVKEQIAKYSPNRQWLIMPREVGLLYMSLLAKYLANETSRENEVTTPGTDYEAYAHIILKAQSNTNAVPGLSFTLNNILPSPHEDVDIDTILNFKHNNEGELLEFRKKIYEFQDKIRNEVRDQSDLSDYLEQFSEELKLEIDKIEKEAEKAKIPTMLGTVETILAAGDSPLIKSIEKALPAPLPLIAQTFAGLVSLRKYQLDQQNAQQEKLMENSFSYIYHAQQEGIVPRQ
jgi:uncharacterized protein DUF6236